VRYLTHSKNRLPLKLSLLRGSRPKSARASPQHLAHNVPNFIQSGSLSVGIAEFAGLEFAGLENDGLENDGLENDGLENDKVEQEQTYAFKV